MNLILKSTLFLFLVLTLNSCKQNSDKKDSDNQSLEQSSKDAPNYEPAHFSLTLKVLIKEADLFQLFYIEENIESYSAQQVLSQEIVPNGDFQEITFDMPIENYPFNLRLDLGTNPMQSSIKIEECRLNYGTNEYVIKGSEFNDYFIFNGGVEMLSDSITFKLKSFKEGTIDKYDPFMMGNYKMNEVLLKKL